MVIPVAAPSPTYPLAYVKLSSGDGCIVVGASKLPSREVKLAAALSWDILCGGEELLPTKVVFTVWLEDNVVEIPESSASTTWHMPSGGIPEDSTLLYAAAGLALALLVLARPRR